MRIKIIGFAGLLVITGFVIYFIQDSLDLGPYFMGETRRLNGYILKKEIVPYGRRASYRIDFEYVVNNTSYKDYYFSRHAFELNEGDSLILKVSIDSPEKCKVIGFYSKKE